MKTYLFTWEIGQGFAHIFTLLLVARVLKAQGHKVVFALRDVRSAAALIRAEGMEVIQAPTHPDRFFPSNGPQPQTMADVMAVFGFAHAKNLRGLAEAWRSILALVRPDAVVANYAPLSLLCAKEAGVPSVLLCAPFEVPPKLHPVPPFRSGVSGSQLTTDDKIIATVNEVFGTAFVSTVHQIFDASQTYFATFAELDPYGPRPDATYVGNLFIANDGPMAEWPEARNSARVFAYLNPGMPGINALREEIQASELSYSIVLRDVGEDELRLWRSSNVCVTSSPVALTNALECSDAVLTYGGINVVAACLLAGKPMVLQVRQLEQYLTAKQVVAMGAGYHARPQGTNTAVKGLHAVLEDPTYRSAATRFAAQYSDFLVSNAVANIAKEVLAL